MKKHILASALLAMIFTASSATQTRAALVPSLSVSPVTGSSQVQVTVFGADPNVSVLLYYPKTSAMSSTNIGTTNANGYLMTTVDSTTLGILSSATVYVTVNGQQSPQTTWPNLTTSSGSLALNQGSLTLAQGQTGTITASVSATLSMSYNSNPSVAGVSISGNQINVNALAIGTTNITICASGIGCTVVPVTVQASSSVIPASIYVSQNNYTLTVGQSQTISLSGSGTYYVSDNSNPGIASASINGSSLLISGTSAGSATINVCASGSNNSVTCIAINVTVSQQQTSTNTTTNNQNAITFSQSQVNLAVGQSQAVTIYGPGGYYNVTNPSPNAVSSSLNGNTLNLTGVAFGGSNISVCTLTNLCGTLYAFVSSNSGVAAQTTSSSVAPAISSFAVATNSSTGKMLSAGNTLTITVSTNQTVSLPTITVGGSGVNVTGTGSGPYTATYKVAGNEAQPLPIYISFNNTAGTGGQAYFTVSNSASAVTASTGSSISSSVGSANTAAAFNFISTLTTGSIGSEVTALQHRLTEDGFYSGPITGKFGALTQTALKKYQAKNGLSQVGVTGPATRVLLNKGI